MIFNAASAAAIIALTSVLGEVFTFVADLGKQGLGGGLTTG